MESEENVEGRALIADWGSCVPGLLHLMKCVVCQSLVPPEQKKHWVCASGHITCVLCASLVPCCTDDLNPQGMPCRRPLALIRVMELYWHIAALIRPKALSPPTPQVEIPHLSEIEPKGVEIPLQLDSKEVPLLSSDIEQPVDDLHEVKLPPEVAGSPAKSAEILPEVLEILTELDSEDVLGGRTNETELPHQIEQPLCELQEVKIPPEVTESPSKSAKIESEVPEILIDLDSDYSEDVPGGGPNENLYSCGFYQLIGDLSDIQIPPVDIAEELGTKVEIPHSVAIERSGVEIPLELDSVEVLMLPNGIEHPVDDLYEVKIPPEEGSERPRNEVEMSVLNEFKLPDTMDADAVKIPEIDMNGIKILVGEIQPSVNGPDASGREVKILTETKPPAQAESDDVKIYAETSGGSQQKPKTADEEINERLDRIASLVHVFLTTVIAKRKE